MANQDEQVQSLLQRIYSLEKELANLKSEAQSLRLVQNKQESAVPQTKTKEPEKTTALTPAAAYSQEKTPSSSSKRIDWESILGENLFIKIGLVSMLLAAIWFLKLAFEKYWINESVRIWLGILTGAIVTIQGIRYLKPWPKIGPSLIGTGSSLFFASYYLGYFLYDLYSLEACFVGLFIHSLTIIALSSFFKNEVVFGFGALGAFLVPVLLSTGENSYQFLFTYLLFWNFIFLLISSHTRWRIAPLVLLIGDHLVFSGWALEKLEVSGWGFPILFQLGTFLIFLYRESLLLPKEKGLAGVLSAITTGLALLFTFLQGIWISSIFFPKFQAAFVLGIVIVYYVFLLASLAKTKETKPLLDSVYGVLALGGTPFILTSIFLGLEGYALRFTLIAFAAFLSLTGARFKSEILYALGIPFWILGIISLVAKQFIFDDALFLLNGRFALFLVSSLLIFASYRIGKGVKDIPDIYLWGSFPVLLLGSFIDVYYNVSPEYHSLGYTSFLAFYGVIFTVVSFIMPVPFARKVGLFCLGIVILKLYIYDFWNMGILARIIAGFALGGALFLTGILYNRSKRKTT
ncbi:DUF2339 domain-containing protein [Leptospira idonii]|uniref:DUF2339 domain-containing protein n=1 Tax=Leptospira idonii TaxID=1193500 RepID=A0A4R9LVC9_9LEPT|nr:DUF2339 domain-containing protein [Leptospira idonii]TGN18140.1 DUF2339 domain-containing protein [Leptospira idonii]